ncbi:hypothetical protein ACFL31_03795 [Candidatus Margulisiibacteriota bacterium]
MTTLVTSSRGRTTPSSTPRRRTILPGGRGMTKRQRQIALLKMMLADMSAVMSLYSPEPDQSGHAFPLNTSDRIYVLDALQAEKMFGKTGLNMMVRSLTDSAQGPTEAAKIALERRLRGILDRLKD